VKTFLEKFQFLVFSILTIIVSVLFWSIAKEHSGTIKILLTQFGYFAPALIAIIMTLIITPKENIIRIKSYLPFIVVILCMVIIALVYGDNYYQIRIDNFLYENPLISIIIAITLIYFIRQIFVNNGANSIDRLVNLPKTKIVWYILAIGIYPLMKYTGVLISSKLFPTQIELSNLNFIILIPLFLFSIIFYASIGEEIGWRGYALKKLQMRYSPFVASIFIGIVWSIWHICYFTLVEKYSLQSIPSVVIWTFIASFFSTWFFNKTNGNVLILILFHASVNFAIIFAPNPAILTAIHLILLIIVFSTGRFFRKLKTEQIA